MKLLLGNWKFMTPHFQLFFNMVEKSHSVKFFYKSIITDHITHIITTTMKVQFWAMIVYISLA